MLGFELTCGELLKKCQVPLARGLWECLDFDAGRPQEFFLIPLEPELFQSFFTKFQSCKNLLDNVGDVLRKSKLTNLASRLGPYEK